MAFIPDEGILTSSQVQDRLKKSESAPVEEEQKETPAESAVIDQIAGYAFLSPSIDKHVAMMQDHRFSLSINETRSSRIADRLQKFYGNNHVQQIIGQVQANREECLDSIQTSPDLEGRITSRQGHGQKLEGRTRGQMEDLMGEDFGDVSIHTDETANSLAQALQAKAFTVGQDVFFREGEYQPASTSGQKLIGHELTHVVQQKGSAQAETGDRARQGPAVGHPVMPSPTRRARRSATEETAPSERSSEEPLEGFGGAGQATAAAASPPPPDAEEKEGSYRARGLLQTAEPRLQKSPIQHRTPRDSSSLVVQRNLTGTTGHREGEGQILNDEWYLIWGTWREGDDDATWTARTRTRWITWRFGRDLPPELRRRMRRELMRGDLTTTGIEHVVGRQYAGAVRRSRIATMVRWHERATGDGGEEQEAQASDQDAEQEIVRTEGEPEETTEEQAGIGSPVATEEEGGRPFDLPSLPAQIRGLRVQPAGGTGIYVMDIDYRSAARGPMAEAARVSWAMTETEYIWEVWNVSNAPEVQAAQELIRRGREPESGGTRETIGRGAGTRRGFERVGQDVEGLEERIEAEQQAAIAEERYVDALAEELNRSLMPLDIAARYGEQILRAVGDLTASDRERQIPWEQEGTYVIRCVATINPHAREGERRRAPSIATRVVVVQQLERVSREALRAPTEAVTSLQLRLAILRRLPEGDPQRAEIPQIERQLRTAEIEATGSPVTIIRNRLELKQAELERVRAASVLLQADMHDPRVSRLAREVEELEDQLGLAQTRESQLSTEEAPSRRAHGVLVSRVTGQTYQLLLQIAEPVQSGDEWTCRLSDVTNRDRECFTGTSQNALGAVWAAVEDFNRDAEYGEGSLTIRLPNQGWFATIEASQRTRTMPSYACGPAAAERNLERLAMVLATLGLVVASPALGMAGGVLAAALAGNRIADRIEHDTFRWDDPETIGDIVDVLSAPLIVGSTIGGLVVRSARGGGVVLRAATSTARATEEALDVAGMIVVGEQTAEELDRISAAVAAGNMTATEARHQRAQVITGAIQSGAMSLGGRVRGAVSEAGGGRPREGATPRPEESEARAETPTTPEPTTPESRAETPTTPEPTTPEARVETPTRTETTEGTPTRPDPRQPSQEGTTGGVLPVPELPRRRGRGGEESRPGSDDWLRQKRAAIAEGSQLTDAGRQAALEVISNVADWRGRLRSATAEDGPLAGMAERLEQVRRDLVNEAMQAAQNEDIVARDVGSRGFGSDIDVTFDPRNERSLLDPATADSDSPTYDPDRLADAVERSGQSAQAFMDHLRARLGGREPDLAIDTNAYTYTGWEADFRMSSRQEAEGSHRMDVVGLVEMRRAMQEANPEGAEAEWNRFREESVQRVWEGDEAEGGEVGSRQTEQQLEVMERIERQFDDAEAMADAIAAMESDVRERLSSGETPPEAAALEAQVAEESARRFRQELVEAFRQSPLDWARIRELQGAIKLVEPESYATRAAVEDVVEHQQRRTAAREDVSPGQTAEHWATGDEFTQGARVTDPQQVSQSATSSLAQLTSHLHGELFGQLKAVAKYCYRIDHCREALGARPDTPEIRDNWTGGRLTWASDFDSMRPQILRDMVQQWAASHGLAREPFDVQARAYIDFRRRWAEDAVQQLRVAAATRASASGEPLPQGMTGEGSPTTGETTRVRPEAPTSEEPVVREGETARASEEQVRLTHEETGISIAARAPDGGPGVIRDVERARNLRDQIMRGDIEGRPQQASTEFMQGEWEAFGGTGTAPVAWWQSNRSLRIDFQRAGWPSTEVQAAAAQRVAAMARPADAAPVTVLIQRHINLAPEVRRLMEVFRQRAECGINEVPSTSRMQEIYERAGGQGDAPLAYIDNFNVLVVDMESMRDLEGEE